MRKNTAETEYDVYDEIVIGAGASGLFYVASDLGCHSSSDSRKLILEKTERPGQKLLMSGSGKCNITHAGSIKDFIGKYGDSGKRIRTVLYKHSNLELIEKLAGLGLHVTEREDGKVYPDSMRASDVLDVLLRAASEHGWAIECGKCVASIKVDASSLIHVYAERDSFLTKKLIIGTGGASYPATGSDGSFFGVLSRDLGLEIAEPRPALTPVYVQGFTYGVLAGVSFEDVTISSGAHTSGGPMLITHKGLSGPAILHISQYVKAGDEICISYLPGKSTDDIVKDIAKVQPGNRTGIGNFISSRFGIPKAFVSMIIKDPDRHLNTVDQKELREIGDTLTCHKYAVSGTGGWNDAMVTKGGVTLDQIDLRTMRVRGIDADIRIIGEALDVNGDTGGYNLQFAYSSAMAAYD